MEHKMNFFEPLLERAEEYGKTKYELFKLKTLNKTLAVVSSFASRAIVIIVFFMFLAILNIGIGLWLGELLGKLYYGFFCVAAFYGILGIVLYFFMHTWLKKKVCNSIILQILN